MNIIDKYKKIRPLYEDYSNRLISLLKSILDNQNIDYHLIEGRAKTVESLEEKVKRKIYGNPLKEITDLCGIRIIVYYQKDISTVEKLIKKNFIVDKENSIDKSIILKNNEFGYLSNHYVIKLKQNRKELPEWETFKDIQCEIQLRTVLQHAWAAISHELQYKSNHDIPNFLKRRLFRLAGLFELADEEFGAVKEKQTKLNEAIVEKKEIDNQKVYEEINWDTVKKFFEEDSEILVKAESIAKKAGFDFENIDGDELPDYSEISELSSKLNIKTIQELESVINQNIGKLENYLTVVFSDQPPDKNGLKYWGASKPFIVRLLLLSLLNKDTLIKFKGGNWSKDIFNRVKKSILKWKKTTANHS